MVPTSSEQTTTLSSSIFLPIMMMNEAAVTMADDWSMSSNLTSHLILSTDSIPEPTRQVTFVGALLVFVFIFFGLFGNIILLTTILSVKKLRSNIINIFIVSLQFNDLINIGFNQFFVGLSYANRGWVGGRLICDLVVYFSTICMGCLLWHHCLIAIHRLIAVVYNRLLRQMSVKTYVIISIVITRVLPILCCIPSFQTYMIKYSPQALRCSLTGNWQILINVTILIVLPCIIIIFCFIGIFFHVYRATHASGRTLTTTTSHSLRREIRITKMFAVLFTLFFFGYHPYGFVRAYDKRRQLHPDIYVLLTVFYCISICASPIVYGIMNTQLRTECVRVILSCWHCQKLDDYQKCTQNRSTARGTTNKPAMNGRGSRASPSTTSLHESALKPLRKDTLSTPTFDTAHV